jgi:hypothetical protein
MDNVEVLAGVRQIELIQITQLKPNFALMTKYYSEGITYVQLAGTSLEKISATSSDGVIRCINYRG